MLGLGFHWTLTINYSCLFGPLRNSALSAGQSRRLKLQFSVTLQRNDMRTDHREAMKLATLPHIFDLNIMIAKRFTMNHTMDISDKQSWSFATLCQPVFCRFDFDATRFVKFGEFFFCRKMHSYAHLIWSHCCNFEGSYSSWGS